MWTVFNIFKCESEMCRGIGIGIGISMLLGIGIGIGIGIDFPKI